MPRRRLGAVLLLPGPVAAEVDGLRRALGDPALGRIPAHLTLVPPVNVRDDAMPDALAVLRDAAASAEPLHLKLGPAVTFMPVNPVLYLDVAGDLAPLRALRDKVFSPPLERTLTWPFVPHVTICDEADPTRIEAALVALADFRVEVDIDRVHLLKQGEGRVWAPIADAPFGPRRVVGRGGLPLELTVSERLDPEAAAFSEREWEVEPTGEQRTPLAVTARRHGRVVGVASGHTRHISTLIVAADERGMGVGAQLVGAYLRAAAEHGAERVTVRTRNDGFYRRLGWVEEARLGDGFVQLVRTIP